MNNVIPFPQPRRPEVETALDRLAAHLAPTIRLSAAMEAAMAGYRSRDAAFERMLDAAIARDDAAYEAAKAEFWAGDAA